MIHDVIVVGGDLAGFATLDGEVVSTVFDDDTDTWTLTAGDGQPHHARVVVDRQPPLVPWIPDLFGRREFRGVSFHAAATPADFDPAGRRIAVIGADAAAGRLIGRLAGSTADVKVFPLPPRRIVPPIARTRRFLRRRHPQVVASPIEELTAVGICTADGVHHDADAIVYGTGFSVRAGLPPNALVGAKSRTIQHMWKNGTEPYLGGTVHGFPNYFAITGADTDIALHYIRECLTLMHGPTCIEVRRSAQQVFNERVHLRRPSKRVPASAFDLSWSSGGVHDECYDGPATLTAGDTSTEVRVVLSGHVEPIDGQYHWQGTVFGALPTDLVRARTVTLAVARHSVSARIIEATAQGAHSMAGVGAPPFAQQNVELTVPRR